MIIGLTGGIASGKSLVTKFLRESGIPIIDTDEIARQVVAPGQPAWHRLCQLFGDAYFLPDGALNRAALAQLIFHDTEARLKLESITHPAIYTEVERMIAALNQQADPPPLIVVVVPLLFETAAETRFDTTVLVTTSVSEQQTRLQRDRGYSPADADARIAAQLPLEEKVARATYILENNGTPDELRQQVRALVHHLCTRAQTSMPARNNTQ